MYYTHHFASQATLERARSWLLEIGFSPASIEAHTDGIPRLTLAVEPTWLSGIQLLIDTVERSDPHGSPGLWDVAHQAHVYPARAVSPAFPPTETDSTTAIGWHPSDGPSVAPEDRDAVSEVMARRWGWA